MNPKEIKEKYSLVNIDELITYLTQAINLIETLQKENESLKNSLNRQTNNGISW